MSNDDQEKVWLEYDSRNKQQRLAEAKKMNDLMAKVGIDADTIVALDFVHFGTSEEGIRHLASQLSENYETEVIKAPQDGYWLMKGTTRPYGVALSSEEHLEWVEFMVDVARSYECVFSTWEIESQVHKALFKSKDIESGS